MRCFQPNFARRVLNRAACGMGTVALLVSCGAPDTLEPEEMTSEVSLAFTPKAQCSTEVRTQIIENPDDIIRLTCSLTLNPWEVIRRPVELVGPDASNIVLDCRGGRISPNVPGTQQPSEENALTIRSEHAGGNYYKPPKNVTIRRCNIDGWARVFGPSPNANNSILVGPSRNSAYVTWIRGAAPSNVVFDDVTIKGRRILNGEDVSDTTPKGGRAKTPLYIGPGVTNFTLKNSTIKGVSNGPGVYLGAESRSATVTSNRIQVKTSGREQLSIDASEVNTISSNRFSELNHGGIYLYRNCGEGGVSRHTTPRSNRITGNVFYYNTYLGDNPAVHLGSRTTATWMTYCHKDDDSAYGSGVSDDDHAKYNRVNGNYIVKREVEDVIKPSGSSIDTPNYVYDNQTVAEEPDIGL